MRRKIDNIECVGPTVGTDKAVVLFHGYGANCDDLASLSGYLDPEGTWDWVFPNGPQQLGMMGFDARAWFPIDVEALQVERLTGVPRDFASGPLPGFGECLASLDGFVKELKSQYKDIVVGGFSQGGMVASHLLPSFEDHLAGALFFSTVLVDRPSLKTKLAKMQPLPFLQSHGSVDQVLPMKHGRDLYQLLLENNWTSEKFVEFAGGHEIPLPVVQKAASYLRWE